MARGENKDRQGTVKGKEKSKDGIRLLYVMETVEEADNEKRYIANKGVVSPPLFL